MRIRGEIIALIMIFVVIIAMAVLVKREEPSSGEPEKLVRSSYRTLPEGEKALYCTLQELHYPVYRLIRPYTLLPKRGLLIVADPYQQQVSEFEGRELLAWLKRGNTVLLLLAEHPEAADALLEPNKIDALKSEHGTFDTNWWRAAMKDTPYTATPLTPSFLSAAAPELRVNSPYRFPPDHPLPPQIAACVGGAVPLYADRFGAAVLYSAVGKGSIVWCSSPWSFSNQGLPEGKNLEFLLALANLQPGAPVIFDEYHHGIGTGVSIWTLAPVVTKWGIVEASLAFLCLLILLAWRFGPPRLPAEERFSRTRAEYLTSMAGLLQRVQATHVVRDRLINLLRRQVSHRLGIHPNADFARFLDANAQLHAVEQPLLERILGQMTDMEQQPRPDQYALLRLATDIQRLLYKHS